MSDQVLRIALSSNELLEKLGSVGSDLPSIASPYASFDPHSLILNMQAPFELHNNGDDGLSPPGFRIDRIAGDLQAKLNLSTSQEHALRIAIEETAWIHELIHFRDFLFSPSGAAYFLEECKSYERIQVLLQDLRSKGWIWENPIGETDWRNFGTDTPTISELVTCYSTIWDQQARRMVFFGDFPRLVLEDENMLGEAMGLQLHGPVQDQTLHLNYFPKRAFVDGQHVILADPIGFRAITEARAVAAQNEIIGIVAPQLVTAYNELLRHEPEYVSVNMMFSRQVRRHSGRHPNHDTSKFTREYWSWLFHSLHGGEQSRHALNPGYVATEILNANFSEDGFTHDSYSCGERKLVDSLIAHAESITDQVSEREDFFAVVMKHVVGNMIVHGLRYWRDYDERFLRRDNALSDFFFVHDSSGRIRNESGLPDPLAHYHDGKMLIDQENSPLKSSLFTNAWFFWISFRVNISEAWRQEHVTCPLVHGQYSELMRSANVNLHEHCKSGCEKKTCGKLRLGEEADHHPKCPWKEHMEVLGFVRG